MRITMLGCGSSAGVPLIGCQCRVCTSTNPKNKRSRVSVFIEVDGINLLIDTSPDLRQQALANNITRVDAVLFTHDHADHTNGIDELRSFNHLMGKSIPVYGSAHTLKRLQERFAYAFLPPPENIWFRPCLIPQQLPDKESHTFEINGVPITLYEQSHGKSKTYGYRIKDFAYSTDVNILPNNAGEILANLRVWIVDCLRNQPSYSHAHLAQTLQWIEAVKPELSILTHMAHDFDYEELAAELPSSVVPGYDGLTITI